MKLMKRNTDLGRRACFASVSLAVWGFCCVPYAVGEAPAAIEAQIESNLKAIRDDAEAIKAARAAMAAKLPKPGSERTPLTLTLSLPHLPAWRDGVGNPVRGELAITLYCRNGKAVALPAVAPGRVGMPCYIDASELRVLKSGLSGSINVRGGDVWSRTITVGIEASVTKENVSGTYSIGADAANGLEVSQQVPFTGKLVPATPRPVLSPAKDDAEVIGSLWDDQYGEAQSLEGVSIDIYDDIRAIVLSMGGRVSYAHATALTVSERYGYPPLPKISASGRVEKRNAAGPSLDDVMDDSVATLEPENAAGPAVNPAVREALTRELANIGERVAARRRIVESVLAESAGNAAPAPGPADTGDPAFGPWYGYQPLPSDKSRANIVPADAGAAGAPLWMQVGNWTAFGPCDLQERGFETRSMPDFVPGPGIERPWNQRFKDARLPEEGLKVAAQPASVEPGSGACRLALCATSEKEGPQRINFPFATTYAWTEVYSETGKELWVGVTVNDHGQLWINDRLGWRSTPDRPVRYMEETGVFKAKFKKGVNRLYLRLDNLKDDGSFVVRVCVRGGPRTAAAVAASSAAQEKAGSPADGAWGWRYDYGGHYDDKAAAPIAWDPHKMKNVRWIKTMGFCHSTPLIVGEKLITFEEPHTAICLNKATGAEIWRSDCDIVTTMSEQIQAEARPVREKAEAARLAMEKLGPDRQSRIAALVKGGLREPQAAARVKEMETDGAAYWVWLQQKKLIPRITNWATDTGHTYPTPVTDGKLLYVKMNTGALACLDLDGNVKWLVNHGVGTGSCGAVCPSPLLVGGRIVVFGPEEGRNVLKAFDPVTGKLLWRTGTQGSGMICGTPAPLRLSNGKDTMDVIATANGALVRADDGKVLRAFVGVREVYGSPVADGNMFTISEGTAKSLFELTMIDRDTVCVRRKWHVDHLGHFQDGNYGMFYKGKLYFARPALDVTDIESGVLEWAPGDLFFCRQGRGYSPVAAAGGRMYFSDNSQWFQPTYRPKLMPYAAAMPVVEAGEPPMPLACNFVDRASGGFSFDKDCLYVRGFTSCMCIGYTGDEGRAWEAEVVADKLFMQFFRDKPLKGKTVRAEKTLKSPQGIRRQVAAADPARRNNNWLVAGPFPVSSETEVVARLSGDWSGYRGESSSDLKAGGQTVPAREMHHKVWVEDVPFGLRDRAGFRHGPHIGWAEMMGRRLDIFRAVSPSPGALGAMACVVRNVSAGTYRFDAKDPRIRCFVGGIEVKHNQVVELPAGAVPVVLIVKLDPVDGQKEFFVDPRFFWPSVSFDSDLAAWKRNVARRRPYLEKVAALAPASESGKRAKAVLEALGAVQ